MPASLPSCENHRRMDLGLRDRACIVTGASRGIGLATATLLSAEGASALLVGRDEEELAIAARACRAAGGQAELLVLDITDPGAGERAAQACLTGWVASTPW